MSKNYLLKTSDEIKQPRLHRDWIRKSDHMGNTWVFPSVSHSIGKCSETHWIESAWEIGTHTLPKIWVLFFHQISILCCTLSRMKKCSKMHPVWETWILDIHTLVRLPFFQQISALWYSTSRQKCMGFPINFSYHGSKIPSMGGTGISVPILLLSYRSFCSIKFPVYHWYIGFPTNFPRYG